MAVSKVAPPHISRGKESRPGVAQPMSERVGSRPTCRSCHPGRHQRLVRVAEGGVRDEQSLLILDPVRRTSSVRVPTAGRACLSRAGRIRNRRLKLDRRPAAVALGVRVSVDDDVAQKVQQLRRPVAPGLEGNSSGVVSIREVVACPLRKFRMRDDVLNKGYVGFDAPDAKFRESPVHPCPSPSR